MSTQHEHKILLGILQTYPLHFILSPASNFSQVFATGTDNKLCPTCTVNCEGYQDKMEPINTAYNPDVWNALHSAGKPWEYLLKQLASRELHVEV